MEYTMKKIDKIKREAVRKYILEDFTQEEIAEKYSIHMKTFQMWCFKFKQSEALAISEGIKRSDEFAEKVKVLEYENDILKEHLSSSKRHVQELSEKLHFKGIESNPFSELKNATEKFNKFLEKHRVFFNEDDTIFFEKKETDIVSNTQTDNFNRY